MSGSETYFRITRLGVSVSDVFAEKRGDSVRRAEFSFCAVTPHGSRWQFRYQMDAMGMAAWHLYRYGEGDGAPAMDARGRDSLGVLPVDYTDDDIDGLLRKVEDNPSVNTYLLVPGHPEAKRRPDFLLFSLNKRLMAFLRAFSSISDLVVKNGVVSCMSHNIADVRCFFLDERGKRLMEKGEGGELGRIGDDLARKGFYMYASGEFGDELAHLPEFIREALSSAKFPKVELRLEKNSRFGPATGILADVFSRPVGLVRNMGSVFSAYESMVRQSRRQEAGKDVLESQDEYSRLSHSLFQEKL